LVRAYEFTIRSHRNRRLYVGIFVTVRKNREFHTLKFVGYRVYTEKRARDFYNKKGVPWERRRPGYEWFEGLEAEY